jgi:hypothetical protein
VQRLTIRLLEVKMLIVMRALRNEGTSPEEGFDVREVVLIGERIDLANKSFFAETSKGVLDLARNIVVEINASWLLLLRVVVVPERNIVSM